MTSQDQHLRDIIQRIAELANSTGEDRPGSSTIHNTAPPAIVCTPKSLPPQLRVSAAKRATDINPINQPPISRLKELMPDRDLTPDEIAVVTSKYWQRDGVRLTVGFLDTDAPGLRTRILAHMNAWGKNANVKFVESATDPQVRISRISGDGHWSYVGTDILGVPADQATMNLDSFTMNTPDSEYIRVVRHETGHTMGFPHEHMRSELVARIDPSKAIAYFGRTQGWTPEEVRQQVLTPIEESSILGTAHADLRSIMCYQIPGTITKDGLPIVGGLDIDESDYRFAGKIYPKVGGSGGHAAPPDQVALTDAQRDVILAVSNEIHTARATRATRSGESGFGPATIPPGREYDAALKQWHPVLRTVLSDNKPPPPPPPLPTQLGPFETGPITFDGGVPVGGSAQLTLFQNGAYNFVGHFHDSGAPSYNSAFTWGIVGASGVLYTFSHSGHMAGTFESGSRDDDWSIQGTNPALAAGWADLARHWSWKWNAGVNFDLNALIESVKQAIAIGQTVAQVVAIVV